MKKTIIIAETIGKYDSESGRPFGHYLEFFRQYSLMLSVYFRIVISASPRYKNCLISDLCESFIPLLETEYKNKPNFFHRVKIVGTQMLNIWKVLLNAGDIILFQSIDSVWGFLPLIFYFGKKQIYFVLYKDLINRGSKTKSWIKRMIFSLAGRRIAGIISGTKAVGALYKSFSIPVLVVPDYVKIVDECAKKQSHEIDTERHYDIAILGINSRSKDLTDVVESFKHSKYRVIIAGKFTDDVYYEEIRDLISDAENIILINKYIPEETFGNILHNARYVLLPYLSNAYGAQSSGVFYDALYAEKPVICRETDFFMSVSEQKLGLVYHSTVRECIPLLDNHSLYNSFESNIRTYVYTLNKGVVTRIHNFLKVDSRIGKNN